MKTFSKETSGSEYVVLIPRFFIKNDGSNSKFLSGTYILWGL